MTFPYSRSKPCVNALRVRACVSIICRASNFSVRKWVHLDFLPFKFLHEGWKSLEVQNFMLFMTSFSLRALPRELWEPGKGSPFCLAGGDRTPGLGGQAWGEGAELLGCRKGSFFVSASAPSPAFFFPCHSVFLIHCSWNIRAWKMHALKSWEIPSRNTGSSGWWWGFIGFFFFFFPGSDTFSGLIFFFCLLWGWAGTRKCCCGRAGGTVRGGSGALSLPTAGSSPSRSQKRQIIPALGWRGETCEDSFLKEQTFWGVEVRDAFWPSTGREEGRVPQPCFPGQGWGVWGMAEQWGWEGGRRASRGYGLWRVFLCCQLHRAFSLGLLLTALPAPSTPHQHPQAGLQAAIAGARPGLCTVPGSAPLAQGHFPLPPCCLSDPGRL